MIGQLRHVNGSEVILAAHFAVERAVVVSVLVCETVLACEVGIADSTRGFECVIFTVEIELALPLEVVVFAAIVAPAIRLLVLFVCLLRFEFRHNSLVGAGEKLSYHDIP